MDSTGPTLDDDELNALEEDWLDFEIDDLDIEAAPEPPTIDAASSLSLSSPVAIEHSLGVWNVVCTMDVGMHINLTLACMTTHGKLGMKIFPTHLSKCRFPPSTNCQFRSGKLVNAGALNFLSALQGATEFMDRLSRDLGYELEMCNFMVQNIVSSTNLGFRVNLNLLYIDCPDCTAKYEPKIFPGLYYRASRDIVFMIFTSGALIATGPCKLERIPVAERLIHGLQLRRYELGKEYRAVPPDQIITGSREAAGKQKKVNQAKVISHARKRELFLSSIATKQSTKKKKQQPPRTATKAAKRKRAQQSPPLLPRPPLTQAAVEMETTGVMAQLYD